MAATCTTRTAWHASVSPTSRSAGASRASCRCPISNGSPNPWWPEPHVPRPAPTVPRAGAVGAVVLSRDVPAASQRLRFALRAVRPGNAAQRAVVFSTAYGQPYADYSGLSTVFGTAIGALPPVLSGRFDRDDFVLLHYLP